MSAFILVIICIWPRLESRRGGTGVLNLEHMGCIQGDTKPVIYLRLLSQLSFLRFQFLQRKISTFTEALFKMLRIFFVIATIFAS